MKATKILEFRVAGVAQPRGSKKAITVPGLRRGLLIDDNKKSGPWMDVVKRAAEKAMQAAGFAAPFDEPLSMRAIVFRERPKGHRFKNGTVKPTAPRFPATIPDCSKYMRGIEDAMKGVVYVDDSRLVDSWPSKRWVQPGDQPGVLITLYRPGSES